MNQFDNAFQVYLAKLGNGERVMVAGRKFRMTELGLKAQESFEEDLPYGVIPGQDRYNRASHGGFARERVK